MKNLSQRFQEEYKQLGKELSSISKTEELSERLRTYLSNLFQNYREELTLPQARVATPMVDALKSAITSITTIHFQPVNAYEVHQKIETSTLPSVGNVTYRQMQFILVLGSIVSLLLFSGNIFDSIIVVALIAALGLEGYHFFLKKRQRKQNKKSIYNIEVPVHTQIDTDRLLLFVQDALTSIDYAVDAVPLADTTQEAEEQELDYNVELLQHLHQLVTDYRNKKSDILLERIQNLEPILQQQKITFVEYESGNDFPPATWFEFEKSLKRIRKAKTHKPAMLQDGKLLVPGLVLEP